MFRRCLSATLLATLILIMLSGCGAPRPHQPSAQITSVAIVTMAVNNYGFFGSQGMINRNLIAANTKQMLEKTEEILEKKWIVKPANSFINSSEYQRLSIEKAKDGLFTPVLDGTVMPIFTKDRKAIIKGNIPPEIAQKLCATLGVDAVVLVYSEWMTDSGKFIPTVKALTKNCFSMYTKDGHKLFFDRKDMRGDRVIGGAFAGVHINENTIDQWVDAYLSAAEIVFNKQ